jgi:hypothetical protein
MNSIVTLGNTLPQPTLFIQPSAVPSSGEAQPYIQIKRAAADSNPGTLVMEMLQNGHLTLGGAQPQLIGKDAAGTTVFSITNNGANYTLAGTGNNMTIDSGSGGANVSIKGLALRLLSYVDAAIAFSVDNRGHTLIPAPAGIAPASSAKGANVTSVTFTGNDRHGTIAIVMAGALAANTKIATCTFGASFGANAPTVMLCNQTSGAGLAIVNFYVQAVSTGVSFDLASNQALAAGTYTIAYIIEG